MNIMANSDELNSVRKVDYSWKYWVHQTVDAD